MNRIYRMMIPSEQNQVLGRSLVFWVLWIGMFTLAYSQAPLYTSNQNQYFLHGLAKAGFGFLDEDWLANTLDPTPVFTWLVFLSYRLFAWPPIFYIYFGILAGVYLFSLSGIADQLWGIYRSRTTRWVFLTLLTGLNAAALRFVFVRALGANWAYLFDGGVAGQRLLGEVLQPSTFGVLLLLSIYLFLQGRVYWSVIPLVLAATVHPTYLLSAAVLTAVYLGVMLWEQRKLRQPALIGLLALMGVLPILMHTLLVFQPTAGYIINRARELLVEFRIPHHALPALWWDYTVLIKIALIAAAIYFARGRRVGALLWFPFIVAVVLTIIQIFTQSDTLALIFPWRLSAVLTPLSSSVLIGKMVVWIDNRFGEALHRNERRVLTICIILSILLALAGAGIFSVNQEEKANSLDRPMMAFAEENGASGQNYLIPLHMQDFRLETGLPVFVEFKSIPYRDVDVLEWYRRVSMAGRLYQAPYQGAGCQALAELSAEGVTHVVLPYDHTVKNCPNLERIYLKFEAYEIHRLLP